MEIKKLLTAQEIETASKMYLEGKSLSEIYKVLGRRSNYLKDYLRETFPTETERRNNRNLSTLSDEDWKDIENLYRSGTLIKDIAEKYNKSDNMLGKMLKEKFPDVIHAKAWKNKMISSLSQQELEEIGKLYKEGNLIQDIANKYNVCKDTLGAYLKREYPDIDTKLFRKYNTPRGILQFNKKEDWEPIYQEYLNGKSLRQLKKELVMDIKTIKNVFLFHGFKRVSKEEEHRRCIENTKQAMLEKYGYELPFKSPEIIQKTRNTLIKKYGVDNPALLPDFSERSQKTCLEKYGVPYYSQTQEMKNKAKETCLEKYGTEYYTQTDEYKERHKQTCLEKYGVESSTQAEEVKEKARKTCLEKYGVDHHMKTPEMKQRFHEAEMKKHKDRMLSKIDNELVEFLGEYKGARNKREGYNIQYDFKCKKCGHIFQGSMFSNMLCPICYPQMTKPELDIREYIESIYDGPITVHYRINGLETDIYLPEFGIGFEYNGVYWHSIGANERITKTYHEYKTKNFLDNNIKVYHIWGYYPMDKVLSRIKGILGKNERIFARNTECMLVDKQESKRFFDKYHLDNSTINKFSIGLYHEGELVSCMSFRAHKEGLELARYATKEGVNVVAGFSKLWKHSIEYIRDNYTDINKIVSYCDRDWTADYHDSVYFKNGLTFEGNSGPILRYYDLSKNSLVPRQKLQRHKLKEQYGEELTDNISTIDFLLSKRILTLYNSGNWKFSYNLT